MQRFTLIIGNKNYSSWSLRPWLMMKYFSIEFDEIVIPLYQSDSKKEILKYSPSGKVPCLKHNDLFVWDSLAICEYLNDFFPENRYWPQQSESRATARSVSAEMHSGFMALRKNCRMDVRTKKTVALNDEVMMDIKRIVEIWNDCRKQFGDEGPFLFGNFSIADAMYAPVVFRFQTYGVELSGAAKQYYKTMLEVPALKEWQDASFKESWTITY